MRSETDKQLSPREKQVLCLIASGRTWKECYLDLGICHTTLDKHIENIRRIIGRFNYVEMAHYALHHGLIKNKFNRSKPKDAYE